jgi:cholesterol transport system auxiliary component
MNAHLSRRIPVPTTAFAAALVAGLFVGACTFSRPAPVKHTFLVEPATPTVAAKPQPATLRVGALNVAAPFRGKAFMYRQTELRFDADFYTEFLVAPAAMMGEGTARALDRARVFARVVPPGAPPDGEYVLDGFVDALYVDMRDAGKPAVEVAITYYLSRADASAPVPFWSKDYRRRALVAASSPEAYAAAMSAAFTEIIAELARDLESVTLAKP